MDGRGRVEAAHRQTHAASIRVSARYALDAHYGDGTRASCSIRDQSEIVLKIIVFSRKKKEKEMRRGRERFWTSGSQSEIDLDE